MNQSVAMKYALFRTIGVRTVLRGLDQFDLGRKVMGAVKGYHKNAKSLEKISLDQDKVLSVLAHELAWKYYNELDAIPVELISKIGRMMRRYNMNLEKACNAYAGRVYTDARARLVLGDLSSTGRA